MRYDPRYAIAFISMAMLLLNGCTGPPEGEDGGRIKVAATIPPQAEFIERVGGDKVDVMIMVPPGASPHTYEPTPSQMTGLSDASLYFEAGSGIEFEIAWMDDLQGVNPSMQVVDCSDGITFIAMEEHHHEDEGEGVAVEEEAGAGNDDQGAIDPHIWTSPANAVIMVDNIYEGLAAKDPENALYYKANRDAYVLELQALSDDISSSLEGKAERRFMVFHPSWGYFADEFDLEQVSIEKDGKEPSVQDLAFIIDEAKEEGVKVVFVSPQFPRSGADAIASEIGGTVVQIDELDQDYLENMRNVATAIGSSLR